MISAAILTHFHASYFNELSQNYRFFPQPSHSVSIILRPWRSKVIKNFRLCHTCWLWWCSPLWRYTINHQFLITSTHNFRTTPICSHKQRETAWIYLIQYYIISIAPPTGHRKSAYYQSITLPTCTKIQFAYVSWQSAHLENTRKNTHTLSTKGSQLFRFSAPFLPISTPPTDLTPQTSHSVSIILRPWTWKAFAYIIPGGRDGALHFKASPEGRKSSWQQHTISHLHQIAKTWPT